MKIEILGYSKEEAKLFIKTLQRYLERFHFAGERVIIIGMGGEDGWSCEPEIYLPRKQEKPKEGRHGVVKGNRYVVPDDYHAEVVCHFCLLIIYS